MEPLARNGRDVVLIALGAQLARALSGGFATIARTIDEITGAVAERPRQISTTPTFAAIWLKPRVTDFPQ